MTQNAATASLHSLLVGDGRTLENFKFFPGDDRGLTASALSEAAESAIRSAFAKGLVDTAPNTGREKRAI